MPNTSASGGYLLPVPAPSPTPLGGDALDAVFQALVVGVTGLPGDMVRPRWQPTVPKQPEPSVDWCAIGVTEDSGDFNPSITHDGAANGGLGQDDFKRHEAMTVLATFYGPNAKSFAKLTRDGMTIAQNSELIEINLLTYINSDTIRAVPEFVNQQWVKRYDLPLHFRRQVKRVYPILNIVSAPVAPVDDTAFP